MVYNIYRISHKDFCEVNYNGSTDDLDRRKIHHKSVCLNEKNGQYNLKLYQFIRNNNIDFDELDFTVLKQTKMNQPQRLEQWYINKFNSKDNGLNTYNAYLSPKQKQEYYNQNKEKRQKQMKEYNKLTWTCIICNKTLTKCHKSHHIRTIKHQNNVI